LSIKWVNELFESIRNKLYQLRLPK
jgi:hypothetical protein